MKFKQLNEFAEPEGGDVISRDRRSTISAVKKIINKHAAGGTVQGEHDGAYMFRYPSRHHNDVVDALRLKFFEKDGDFHSLAHMVRPTHASFSGESQLRVWPRRAGEKR